MRGSEGFGESLFCLDGGPGNKLVARIRVTLKFKFNMNTVWERTDYSNNMVGCLSVVRWQKNDSSLATTDLSNLRFHPEAQHNDVSSP